MLAILPDIESVDTALKQWLVAMQDGLIVSQMGEQPDLRIPRMTFDMIGMQATDFAIDGYTVDDNYNPIYCTVQEYTITFQIDALYCRNAIELIIKLIRYFKSGRINQHGEYLNLAYSDNSAVRRLNFYKQHELHYRSTVDVEFIYRCMESTPVNSIEQISLTACNELNFATFLTVNKP